VDSAYSNKKVKIQVHMATEATSTGDCLRYVEEMGVIEDGSTFMLVHGDVVSNVPLTPIIEAHKERYEKNASNIMTVTLKHLGPGHKMRTAEANIAVALAEDMRLLAYVDQNQPKVQFPMEIFQEHDQVECRVDVIDSHIYVCSKEVLNLFKDEFDVKDMFAGIKFIHTDELYGFRIYATILEREYAARATDIHCYDAISKDILFRWTYPFVPDVFCEEGDMPARRKRYNIYLCDDVLLTRGCVIEENTLVGEGTQIGRESAATTVIKNCIIGKDCVIGAGVYMDNVYLFDNVVIEDGCRLDKCILGSNVKIHESVNIGKRCVLGHNTIVGADAILPDDTVIADLDGADDDDFTDSEDSGSDRDVGESDEILGEGGRGKVVEVPDGDDDDDDNMVRYGWVGDAYLDKTAGGDEDAVDPYMTDCSSGSESDSDPEPADPFEGFLEAMIDLIGERVTSGNVDHAPLDELRLETRSNRAAYNMSMLDVVLGLSEAIVKSMDELGDLSKSVYAGKLKKIFVKLAPLFSTYVKEIDAVDFVNAIEDACFLNDNAMSSFQTVVHALYEDETELITEESVLKWYNSNEPVEEENEAKHNTLKVQAKPFVDWLQTASSEEEDSD